MNKWFQRQQQKLKHISALDTHIQLIVRPVVVSMETNLKYFISNNLTAKSIRKAIVKYFDS